MEKEVNYNLKWGDHDGRPEEMMRRGSVKEGGSEPHGHPGKAFQSRRQGPERPQDRHVLSMCLLDTSKQSCQAGNQRVGKRSLGGE